MKSHFGRRNFRKPVPRHNPLERKRRLRVEQLEARILLAADPLFRINAGGPQLSATPVWSQDTTANPSPYVNATSSNSVTASTSASINLSHSSVPAGTPMA